MTYDHNQKTARDHTELALKLMAERKVPATPDNYAVWYAYACGENAELRQMIDAITGKGEEFTATRNAQLHEKFFGTSAERKEILETASRIETAISRVLEILGATGEETSRYGKALESYSGQLEKPLQIEEVREIVHNIAAETRQIVAKQGELDDALERSSKEITELRQDLQNTQREALTDSLTGIANRKQFDLQLKEMVRDSIENNYPLSLLFCDIDFFKNFNDTFGHAVGDQVLRLVARTIVETIKGRDLPARMGGEEFAIILPSTELSDSVIVGNQIRIAVGTRKIVVRSTGKNLGSVQISLGAAEYVPGESLDAFVERADRALYAAKRNGRNQVFSDGVAQAIGNSPKKPDVAKSA